ncbi:1,4-dihydroxy-2-naphthoate polyprenyltransferase [Alkalitalea saponilacus]|uniref:1,4-dihydroxy-2-naphthoate octaprenyltransferase n=1 Tax=Alkalitalea saponilacus TaxID=889453 RepID=A0A1T5HS26_9BACT|nr:1,4-dihydroxy-2-naphthoate polyprenyltransferase [Alkalitalea saponilacus]ASB50001.1 1,4-dihydroxy-2-naphthoate polyprenyltransferase [Alkalitalea saponilacus]SKC23489.1 1,4-dihydroxy-2-naphthoate prenyltransferase [Alkalitalea saponilacus]
MSNIKAWMVSLRLRTLPLALSTIFMGSIIAAWQNNFNSGVLLWAAITTLFLQVLSNLANDYGDAKSGADNENRVGPQRMIQQGVISMKQMKTAMVICVLLSLISGITLLFKAFNELQWQQLLFFILGIAAIAAAIRYTVGSNPYGYRGLGDMYVFIFFGLLGVAGTWFLHTNTWQWHVLLPASTIGLFSAGVLNLNNIRDIDSDRQSNKITLVVRMGKKAASWYHLFLIASGWITMLVFVALFDDVSNFWPLFLTLPLFIRNIIVVFKNKEADKLDVELRNLAVSTLLFVLLSGVKLFF